MSHSISDRLWVLRRGKSSVPGKQGRESSEVMAWINANPDTPKCDRFKSLYYFKKAWLEFANYPPGDDSLYRGAHIDDVRRFLKTRVRPWKKAVKEITGKPDETKATAAFRSFYSAFIAKIEPIDTPDENRVGQTVADFIKERKSVGMTVEEIKRMREDYQASPRRAPRTRKK